MPSLIRIPGLAAALLVAVTVASNPARADQDPKQPILNFVGEADLDPQRIGECHLQRRAISRRACKNRFLGEMDIDTPEND